MGSLSRGPDDQAARLRRDRPMPAIARLSRPRVAGSGTVPPPGGGGGSSTPLADEPKPKMKVSGAPVAGSQPTRPAEQEP